MRETPSDFLEQHRIKRGVIGSTAAYGNNGAFALNGPTRHLLHIIASDTDGWEHVSVSLAKQKRTPTWEEMCFVKDLFWHEEECVIQYHPPKSEYVNCHAYTLHLWRPVEGDIILPPSLLVGPKGHDESVRVLDRLTMGGRIRP